MKRTICLILLLALCLLSFTSCQSELLNDNDNTVSLKDNADSDGGIVQSKKENGRSFSENEFAGAWLSYYDLSAGDVTDEKNYENYINGVFENLKKLKINNVFIQVRPFADAFYPSKIFDTSKYAAKKRGAKLSFDVFACVLKSAKKYGMSPHAWINPYRVQNEYNVQELSGQIGQWAKENSRCVVKYSGGLYLNPAKTEVINLIADGVREILENYDVCGIHMDDYFYPTDDSSFDKAEYEQYLEAGGAMPLSQWRRDNVNTLVKTLYNTVKSYDKEKVFSISPSADIEKNTDTLFADVKRWAKGGYCDMLIPQIYFGFENSTKPFKACVQQWKELCGKNIKLVIGLALYKAGQEDVYAGKGKNEWLKNSDVISRQVQYLRSADADGFCLFSAGNVNFNKNLSQKECQNLLAVV